MTKKLKFLAFALIAVLTCVGFASCGDDDKDEPTNNSIVGKWNCYKVVLDYDGNTYPEDVDFDFKSDNSFSVNLKSEGKTATGTYTTTQSGAFTVQFDGDALVPMSGTYTISGNELVAKYKWDSKGTAYLKRIK